MTTTEAEVVTGHQKPVPIQTRKCQRKILIHKLETSGGAISWTVRWQNPRWPDYIEQFKWCETYEEALTYSRELLHEVK